MMEFGTQLALGGSKASQLQSHLNPHVQQLPLQCFTGWLFEVDTVVLINGTMQS